MCYLLFSLAAFNICSLCLIFVNLINMCLWGVSPWVYSVWDSLGFLDLGDYFLSQFREVFNYYLLKDFLMVFLFIFFFWDSCISNVGAFSIVLYIEAQGCVPVLLENLPGMSCSGTSWPLGGAWFQCRHGGV